MSLDKINRLYRRKLPRRLRTPKFLIRCTGCDNSSTASLAPSWTPCCPVCGAPMQILEAS